MADPNEFLYPMFYTGPKAEKAVDCPGHLEPIQFKQGALSQAFEAYAGMPHADVTEADGRYLIKRFGSLFAWAPNVEFTGRGPTQAAFDALVDRVAALEAMLRPLPADAPPPSGVDPATLPAGLSPVQRRGGRPKKGG